MLEARNIKGGYGGADILKGVSLTLHTGDLTVIIGPNGAGKSTLMKALFGLVPVRRGEVWFEDFEITHLPTDQRVARGLAYVPQEKNVFPSLTIEENLQLGAYLQPQMVADGLERAYAFFPDLATRRRQLAGTLSGGQRQMVAIARALMMQPRLLMLDEPTAGLSPAAIAQMFEKIAAINAEGVTMLMVEQNAKLALTYASHGYVLASGRNRYQDSGRGCLEHPEIAAMFLGG